MITKHLSSNEKPMKALENMIHASYKYESSLMYICTASQTVIDRLTKECGPINGGKANVPCLEIRMDYYKNPLRIFIFPDHHSQSRCLTIHPVTHYKIPKKK